MTKAAIFGLLVMLVGCEAAPLPAARLARDLTVSKSEIATLANLAESACQCDRSSPEGPCWAEFNEAVAGMKESVASATACAPVSTELRCFNESASDGGFCIVTGHTLVFGEGQRQLCSKSEAQIVEATYNATLASTGDNYQQAAEAAGRAADALARGESPPRPTAEPGCTG